MNNSVEVAYREIHPRLWRALLAYCGNPDVASDAEAEAFTQALRRGDEIRDVKAWVWRTAFKVAKGMLSRQVVPLMEDDRDNAFALEQSNLDPALVEFLSQLSGLSEQQRAIVVLRYVGNFKPTEVADLLHTTPGSVRVQLHRAHAELRTQLEHADD